MADVFSLGAFDDTASWNNGPSKDTGDLRRKYNFGDRVSELNIAQDPFFRFVSKVSKKPTDDPEFKFTERRPSYHKRYAYVSNHGTTAPSSMAGDDATVTHGNVDAGDIYYFCMIGDYKSAGNIQNIYGQTGNDIVPGVSGSQPAFFLPNSVIKIPYLTTFKGSEVITDWEDDAAVDEATTPDDYLIAKVLSVDTTSVSHAAILKTEIINKGSAAADFALASYEAHDDALDTVDISSRSIANYLERKRCYVVGSAHAQGTGYPETWKDQPFSTAFGLTQIWKTAMAMDNTTRATVLKYEPNEFARIWREKLIEHKFDIEQSLLFGSQGTDSSGAQYTEGAVDFCVSYGNIFDGSGMGGTGTKSQDDFLDDMSSFLDPRYNNANATLFMVSTDVYNWLHKLSGYFSANVSKVADYSSSSSTALGRADFNMGGKKSVFGVDITQIYTPYGVMNVSRNIHLDGTGVKMLAVNMKNCAYRPLVGNGLNRDTAVYVGVQTLENSGVDRRVDLIQTEAGMEWQMPESHAVWK
tara:strand:- start:3553 stop:5130 length:1578 start_codon:yes stop_codon:yes gene_type:complete